MWVASLSGNAARFWLWAGDGFVFENGGGGEVTADKDWALWLLGHGLNVDWSLAFWCGLLDVLDIFALWAKPVEEGTGLGGREDGCRGGGCRK